MNIVPHNGDRRICLKRHLHHGMISVAIKMIVLSTADRISSAIDVRAPLGRQALQDRRSRAESKQTSDSFITSIPVGGYRIDPSYRDSSLQ